MTREATELRSELLRNFDSDAPELSLDQFDVLARRVFAFQFEHNAPYRAYCERRNVTPATVTTADDVPGVPTAAFKEVPLVCGDPDKAEAIFHTSGTTRGAERRGTHHVMDLALYEQSLLPAFRSFLLPDGARLPIIILVPPPEELGDSSLSHMAGIVAQECGGFGTCFCASASGGLKFDEIFAAFDQSVRDDTPVLVFATSLAMLHLLDEMARRDLEWQLPHQSRIMDTGGFKGEKREISPADLRTRYFTRLCIPDTYVVNEYGMTEMCSQMYDDQLRTSLRGGDAVANRKQGPPWLRTTVVDPESLAPVPEGRTGLLRHFDLANLFSVSAIQTEDVGTAVPGGFILHGRASGAVPRGCSIAMDILLDARARS